MNARTAAVIAFAAGVLARSELARRRNAALLADRDRWRSRATEDGESGMYRRLGPHAWLLDAVERACGELRDGEQAETLTVGARWKNSPDRVLVATGREDEAASRVLKLAHCDETGRRVWVAQPVYLPSPGSADWAAGS